MTDQLAEAERDACRQLRLLLEHSFPHIEGYENTNVVELFVASLSGLMVAHLRASQPATETGGDDACKRLGIDVPAWAAEVRAKVAAAFPDPQPVEGVSDEELTCDADASATSKRTMAALLRCVDRPDLFDVSLASVLYAFGLRREARSSAAKDARIAELEATAGLAFDLCRKLNTYNGKALSEMTRDALDALIALGRNLDALKKAGEPTP